MIKYPAMRGELILNLRALADVSYQQRVWVKHERPKEIYEDGFDFAVHFIFDDMALDTSPQHAIGAILYDEAELFAVQEVVAAINEVLADLGSRTSDKKYISSRYWPKVVAAARQAYKILTKGKDPDGLFQAIQRGEPLE
jgi:hypothetical protein